MINLELLDEKYKKYKYAKDMYQSIKKDTEKYFEENKSSIEWLYPIYKEIVKSNIDELFYKEHGYYLSTKLRDENKVLDNYIVLLENQEYVEEELRKLTNFDMFISEEFDRYVAIKHENGEGYDLINLYTNEKIDLSLFESLKEQFLVTQLINGCSFIGYIEQKDIPLLLNVIDEIDYEGHDIDIDLDDDNFDDIDKAEEEYYLKSNSCYNMNLALIRAHMFDNNQDEIEIPNGYGLMRPKQIIRNDLRLKFSPNYEYSRLNPKSPFISEQGLKQRRYYLDILTKRNVEELYLTASEEDKEYVIDSYLDAHEEYDIRTASSIINMEVLKRKQIDKDNNKFKTLTKIMDKN